MNSNPLTYEHLFVLLESLGFKEDQASNLGNAPRVFVHTATDTVLLLRNAPGDIVTPADMLSTEVHLHANNIIDQSLESLVNAESMK
jgi:hypothetical protein